MQPEDNKSEQTTSRTRVLWVIKTLNLGGAEQLLLNLARVHDRNKIEFECAYLLASDSGLVHELQTLGIRCHKVTGTSASWLWPLQLWRLIRKAGFDVIHSHSPLPAIVARFARLSIPRRRRPSGVATEHSPRNHLHRLTRIANRITAPSEDVILAVSSEVLQSISGKVVRRSRLLVHGVPVAEIGEIRDSRALVRNEFNFKDSEIVIGTIANLRQEKGYPNLLEALKIVTERGVSARCLAVGHGPLLAEITRRAEELELTDVISLLGLRRDAVRVMSGCDVFVLASSWEGFPVAVMEALALGLPIVATSTGGIQEHLSADPFFKLVPPDDPHSLATALEEVASSPELRVEMTKASLSHASKFDSRIAAHEIEVIYEELVRTSLG